MLECDLKFNDKFLKDTIGIKADVEPCKNPAQISLDITGVAQAAIPTLATL